MNYLALPRQERLTPQPSLLDRDRLRPTLPRKSWPLPAPRAREWPVNPRNPASNHRAAKPQGNPSPVIVRKPANREITPIGHRLTTGKATAGRAALLPSTRRGTRIPESPRTAFEKRLRPRKNPLPRTRLQTHPDGQPRLTTKNLTPKLDHPDFDTEQMISALREIEARHTQALTTTGVGKAEQATMRRRLRSLRTRGNQESGLTPRKTLLNVASNIDINAFRNMLAQLGPGLGEFGGTEAVQQLLIWQLATEITSLLLQEGRPSDIKRGKGKIGRSAFGMEFMPRSYYTTFAFDVNGTRIGMIGAPNALSGLSPALMHRIVAHELDHLFNVGKSEDDVRAGTGTKPRDITALDPNVYKKMPKGMAGGYCSYGRGSWPDRLFAGRLLEPDYVIDLAKMGSRLPA